MLYGAAYCIAFISAIIRQTMVTTPLAPSTSTPIAPASTSATSSALTTAPPAAEVYPTPALVAQVCPDSPIGNIAKNLPYILKAMCAQGLTSKNQLIAMIATIYTEVTPFSPIEEYGKGAGEPYGATGFYGRGYIQLTWEDNYKAAEAALGIAGLAANPALALEPENAAKITVWYWTKQGNVAPYAESGDWQNVRSTVNAGSPGNYSACHSRDIFEGAIERAVKIFTQDLDPAAIGVMPIDGAYGLNCLDPGTGGSRTISHLNPQNQGAALAHALGITALAMSKQMEAKLCLDPAADEAVLDLEPQKTFELKGIGDDFDGTYIVEDVLFFYGGRLEVETTGYQPDPNAPAPTAFVGDTSKGLSPASTAVPPTADGEFLNPCAGNPCISRMGWRESTGSNHRGIDLAGANYDILACADGVVVDLERGCSVGDMSCGGGYGNLVFIKHNINGEEIQTDYCHLESVEPGIAKGSSVTKGQKIGRMGDTGHSFGPHLHLQFSKGGTWLDPFAMLKPQPAVEGNGGSAIAFR